MCVYLYIYIYITVYIAYIAYIYIPHEISPSCDFSSLLFLHPTLPTLPVAATALEAKDQGLHGLRHGGVHICFDVFASGNFKGNPWDIHGEIVVCLRRECTMVPWSEHAKMMGEMY